MEELNEFEKRKRARRYLCQIQKYCDEIKLREEALRELNSTLAYKAKGVAAGGGKPGVNIDGLARDVVKYLMDEDEYHECIVRLKELKEQIIKEIYSLPEPLHCKILAIKYIKVVDNFWTAAEMMDYSYSNVRRLHRKALVSFYDHVLRDKEI